MSVNEPQRQVGPFETGLGASVRGDEVVRLYELRSREVPDPVEAANLLARAGTLARERLKDLRRAEELFGRALVYSPANREALGGLAELLGSRQDWVGQVDALERLGQLATGSEAAALYAQAAAICDGRLKRRDRAVLLLQLASRGAPREPVHAEALRRLLVAEGRWRSAFEVLEAERRAFGARELIEPLAELAEALVDWPQHHGLAQRALERILEREPGFERAQVARARLEQLPETWRQRVRELQAASLDERDRRAAARQALKVAALTAHYAPDERAQVLEAVDRAFALWPAMPEALDFLEAQGKGDVAQVLQALSRVGARAQETQAQVDVLLRAGQLLLTALSNRDEAARVFTQAAKLDPSRGDAATLASEVLVDEGRRGEAVALLEAHLACLRERRDQLALRRHLADLAERGVRDTSLALKHLRAAQELEPANPVVAYRLTRLYVEVGLLDAAWPIVELALSAPVPATARADLCEALSKRFEAAGDARRSAAVLALALPLAPARPGLVEACQEAATRAGTVPALAETLKRAAALAPPAARGQLWKVAGRVLLAQGRLAEAREAIGFALASLPSDEELEADLTTAELGLGGEPADPRSRLEAEVRKLEYSGAEPQALAEVYRRILAVDPHSVPTLKKLAAAAEAAGAWLEVATVAERLVALAVSAEERREWRARLAQVCAEQLDRKSEAVGLYLALLTEDPHAGAVVGALERLASQGVRRAEVARALAPVYAARGDFQRQAASLLVLLGTTEDPLEQAQLLSLLAEVSESKLEDARAALGFRQRGVALMPDDAMVRHEASRLARVLEAQGELSRFFTELAASLQSDERAVALLLDSADLAAEARALDEGIAALREAARRSPARKDLRLRLAALLGDAGRTSEQVEVLRAHLELERGPGRLPVLASLARLNERLDRPGEAAAALRELSQLTAVGVEDLRREAELWARVGRPREQVRVLQRLLELAESAGDVREAQGLRGQLEKLALRLAGSPSVALDCHATVLDATPDNAEALAAVEALLGDATVRLEAARVLAVSAAKRGDARRELAALAIVAEAAADGFERLTALRRSARLSRETLRQPEQAFTALVRAVALAPDDAGLRAEARAVAEAVDALDAYAEVLETVLGEERPRAAASLHAELAELYERKLGDEVAAVKHLNALLAIDADHEEALRTLQRIHRAAQAWAGLLDVTERLAERAFEPERRLALWREAALLAEQRLEDPERAAQSWRRVAELEPTARDAALALDRLATELGRAEELAFALELRRSQEGAGADGREIALRLAALRLRDLDDPLGAIELYRQILAEDARHAGAQLALEELVTEGSPHAAAAMGVLDAALAQQGAHHKRVELRERRLAARLPGGELARLEAELRGILERELGQPEAAFMRALRCFADGIDRTAVQLDLERLAALTGNFEELAEVYEAETEELPPSDPQGIALLRRAAELREQLHQHERAIEDLEALVKRAPNDRLALARLSSLLEQSENARNLSAVLARQAALASIPMDRLELLLKAADAWEDAGQDEQALEALQRAREIEPRTDVLVFLERLSSKLHRHEEAGELLRELARRTEAPDARRELALRAVGSFEKARCYEGVLAVLEELVAERGRATPASVREAGGPPRADAQVLAALERLASVEAVRSAAQALVERLLRAQGDVRRLAELLEGRLATAKGAARVELALEVARLREQAGQKAQAFTVLLAAFGEEPNADALREGAIRLGAHLGAYEELADAIEAAVGKAMDEHRRVGLWRQLAVLAADRLERPDRAIAAAREVLAREPDDRATLRRLAGCLRRTARVRELADVMRAELALESSVEGQLTILYELATLAEDELGDRPLALECYRAILERATDDLNALRCLGRLLASAESWPELAAVLERERGLLAERGDEDGALELALRLAHLKLTRLGDPRGALDTYQEVLRRRPGHPGAIGALADMARSDNPLKGEAATILEPVFENEGDHLKQVQMLEARLAAETAPAERAALLRRVAGLYARELADPELAFLNAARALREAPDDAASLELVLDSGRAAEVDEEVATLLAEVAPRVTSDAGRVALQRQLGRLLVRADERSRAADAWRRVLELAPTDPEALEVLSELLGALGRGAELAEIQKRRLTVEEDPERRLELLLSLAKLQHEQQKDPLAAMTTLRRALELRPDEPVVLERLERLCESQQRWPEVADLVERRLKAAAPSARTELLLRLATVKETHLRDRAGAVDLLAELLAGKPDHPVALSRLEAVAAREPTNERAVGALLDAYRRSGDVDKRTKLLEARAAAAADPAERKQLLQELATVREGQGDPLLAYLAHFRAFKEDPNDREQRAKLEAAATAAESWDELVEAYEGELARIKSPADGASVCMTLGGVFEQRLDDAERAASYYARALELDPSLASRALAALERIYGQLDDPERQARALEGLAALQTDPADQVGMYFRLGQLVMERLDRAEQAATAFERVLRVDPKHLPALRCLELIYEQAKMSPRLYAVLEAQRDLVSGPERDRVLARMAAVSADGLENAGHSIALYRELLLKNPRNEQAFEALSVLLEKEQRAEELRELLVGRLQVTVDPREVVKLNERIGRVLYRQLERPEEAIPYFKAALERDARLRTALEALRDIYDGLGRRDELSVVLRRLIPLQEDALGVKRVRLRLAEVLAEAGRREETLDAARRVLEVEPHTIDELERVYALFAGLKAWPDAVRALELASDVYFESGDQERAVEALFTVADLWRGVAGRPEAAGAALQKILEVDRSNRRAYEQALALFSKLSDWRAYAQVMEHFLPALVTDEEKVAAMRELATVQEQRLGQKDTAFLQCCRALPLAPSDAGLRATVERLAEETGSFDELAAVYEEVADGLPRGPLAETLYLTLARVQDEHLDEPAAAEAALRKVLEFDPTNGVVLEALKAMFARRGQNEALVEALEQKLESADGIEARKAVLLELARTWEERLGNLEEAERALRRSLELEPDVETFGLLVSLQRGQGQFRELVETLLRMRDLASSPEASAPLQLEIAQLHERELDDDEAAIEAYRRVFDYEPTNAAALTALERLYSKLDRPGELLGVYERQVELTEDYRERVKILFKSASIWEERFQNLENADVCIAMVLEIEPQNVQAVRALERLRRAEGRFEELPPVLERHVELVTEPEERAAILVGLGQLYEEQLRAIDRAADAYQRALEFDATSRGALNALGRLYERSGNWPQALEMLEREAAVLGAVPEAVQEAVELKVRIGKIHDEMLMDGERAKRAYLEALELDPAHLPALQALKGLYEREGDDERYEAILNEEARRTEDGPAKARAYLDVARYCERRGKRDAAAAAFEAAIDLEPELAEAAGPLADLYLELERWADCERMLDVVVANLARSYAESQDDPELSKELSRRSYRLGYVCEKLGKSEKALGAYERAYQLDPTFLPVLEGYGHLLIAVQRLDEAQRVYQGILVHHRSDLTDLEVAEIYWTLGDLNVRQGQRDRAENHFEKALSIDPLHEATLRSMVALSEEQSRWDRAVEYGQKLLTVVEPPERFAIATALGRTAAEKLADPYVAIEAYLAASRERPDALEALEPLYRLYRETKQGVKAADVLERMLATPALRIDGARTQQLYYALGEIARDDLQDLDRALAAFNAALDLDWRFLEAFSAIEGMLARARKWRALDENYKRMLSRIPKIDETHRARMSLWQALGDLYLNVLKAPEAAVEVYKVVATGLPDDVERQEQFAVLASTQPGRETDAVEAWRRALPQTANPGRAASGLAELAARRKDYDSAWLAAQVAVVLIGEVGPGEKEILTKLTPYARKREVAQRQLTDRLWHQHLFHPKVRGPLGEILALVFEQAAASYKEDFARFGVNPKRHLIDVATATEFQLHLYRYVSRLFGMDQVSLYSPFLVANRERNAKKSGEPAPDPMVGVELLHTDPVALKVGGRFFSEMGQKEVYYLIGRAMALLRPELILTQRLSTERLEAVLQAAISFGVDRFRFTADRRAIDAERRTLERALTEQAKGALVRIVREYAKVATPADVSHFLEGVELTATRAGAFAAGDLEPVKRMVLSETGSTYRVQPRAKVRDLMVFALGEDLHALRVAVGSNVEVTLRKGG